MWFPKGHTNAFQLRFLHKRLNFLIALLRECSMELVPEGPTTHTEPDVA